MSFELTKRCVQLSRAQKNVEYGAELDYHDNLCYVYGKKIVTKLKR